MLSTDSTAEHPYPIFGILKSLVRKSDSEFATLCLSIWLPLHTMVTDSIMSKGKGPAKTEGDSVYS